MVLIRHRHHRRLLRITRYVSVPLRGLWFLSSRDNLDLGRVWRSFRPLAGIMVLITVKQGNDLQVLTMFPSPCGDYGSYRIKGNISSSVGMVTFPSPCGDYGSYLPSSPTSQTSSQSVSVPLRGLWFLSSRTLFSTLCLNTTSFRPLAGIMVLIKKWEFSKVGECACFRPLAGIMVLIMLV